METKGFIADTFSAAAFVCLREKSKDYQDGIVRLLTLKKISPKLLSITFDLLNDRVLKIGTDYKIDEKAGFLTYNGFCKLMHKIGLD